MAAAGREAKEMKKLELRSLITNQVVKDLRCLTFDVCYITAWLQPGVRLVIRCLCMSEECQRIIGGESTEDKQPA